MTSNLTPRALDHSTLEVSSLQPGALYVFHVMGFQTPTGDFVPGQIKPRKFVGMKHIGAVGMPKTAFVEVERDDTTRHLIAVDYIASIEPLGKTGRAR